MRTNSLLAFMLLTQVYFVNCQLGFRRDNAQGTRRHASVAAGPSPVFPEFLSRTFGLTSSDESDKPPFKRRSSVSASHSTPVKSVAPANKRPSRRPYATRGNQRLSSGSFADGSGRTRGNLRGPNPGANKQAPSRREKPVKKDPTESQTASPSVAVTPPKSLEGWVSHPTEASVAVTTKIAPVSDKAGQCGSTFSYGIQCAVRMDQCSQHSHCPGDTRCCMVEECGYMCVKPKAKSEGNKKRGSVASVWRRQSDQDDSEVSTTSMGLKLDDIALHVEDT